MIEILKRLIPSSYRTIEYTVAHILSQTPTDAWAPVMPFSKNDEMNTKLGVNKRQWLAVMTRPPTPLVIPCSRPTERPIILAKARTHEVRISQGREYRNATDLFNWHRSATVSEDGTVRMGVWFR